MSLLTPIGLLGLIGLIVWLIIYLIKPNYQNKVISSTFIWNLSLKYRKRKLPINKLRNILLIICQILIITVATFILTQPYIPEEEEVKAGEKVIIIDVSASMLAECAGETRMERAVDMVTEYAKEAIEEDEQKVSVILASDKASFLMQEVTAENASDLYLALSTIVDPSAEERYFTYGTPDIDGAIKLAEEITAYTPDVEVRLYTDTTYIDKGRVNVIDVKDASEWNAAILDVRATMVDNYYVIEVDVASYGADSDVMVYCDLLAINGDTGNLSITSSARCSGGEITTLRFANYEENEENKGKDDPNRPDEIIKVTSYESIHVHIDEADSLAEDNVYYLYGGTKPTLKVQYYSSLPNNYFSAALMVLDDQLNDRWNIEITEVKKDNEPAIEGFDVYIFEHATPPTLPIDGIVIVMDPTSLPASTGMKIGEGFLHMSAYLGGEEMWQCYAEDPHPIMNGINPENIGVSLYHRVITYGDFTPIMGTEDEPIMFVRNDIDCKMVVMNFNMNYSDFAMKMEFPLFMYNIFEYFTPATLTGHVYQVNDGVKLNSRSDKLYLSGPDSKSEYVEFPAGVTVSTPGVYTVTQTLISGEESVENFYVKLSAEESNIALQQDVLSNPFYYEEPENDDLDLILYFAIAIVSLLFIEWWLKSKEQL